jgi:hypothetical protein
MTPTDVMHIILQAHTHTQISHLFARQQTRLDGVGILFDGRQHDAKFLAQGEELEEGLMKWDEGRDSDGVCVCWGDGRDTGEMGVRVREF